MLKTYKTFIVFLLIGALSLNLIGCGSSTPSNTNTAQKESWQKVLTQDETEEYCYQAPDRIQEEWNDDTGKLKVIIDAEVKIPEESGYPIASLTQQPIDSVFLETLQNAVVPSESILYKADDTKWSENMYVPTMSQSDIQAWINYLQTILLDDNSILNKAKDTNTEQYESSKVILEDTLKQYQTILDEIPPGFCETSVQNLSLYNANDISTFLFDAGKTTKAMINISHDITGFYHISFNNKGFLDYSGSMYLPNTLGGQVNNTQSNLENSNITYMDAYNQAIKLTESLGVNQRLKLCNSWSGYANIAGLDLKSCYYFSFDNAQKGLINKDMFWAQKRIDQQNSSPIVTETLIVCVDDDGIVSFDWINPCSINTIKENVQLMDFSQLMDQEKSSINIVANVLGTYKQNDLGNEEVVESDTLEIHTIDLCLNALSYDGQIYLIPAWNFNGKWTRKYTQKNYSVEPEITNEESELVYEGPLCCLFSINAIDGTIISYKNE